MMNKKYVGFAVGGACLALSGYLAHEVRAAGPPGTNPLAYAGVLEDNGKPVTGERNLALVVWNAATNGDEVCDTVPSSPTAITDGHFEVVLSEACQDAVADNPDLWVEVSVDGDSLGRQKIRAVPYALEAKNAVAVGAYDEAKLDDLAGRTQVTRYRFSRSPVTGTIGFTSADGTSSSLAPGSADASSATICRDYVDSTTTHHYFDLGATDPGTCTLAIDNSASYGGPGIRNLAMPTYGKASGGAIEFTCAIPDTNAVFKVTSGIEAAVGWSIICVK